MDETCFLLAPSTKHPDYNQSRCPDVLTSLVLHMLHVSTQHQTPRLQPEETTRQQTSLIVTCFMLAPSTKHPDSSQRRCPDSRQVLFSTCFMLASTQHQTPRLQPEETTRQQTSLVRHMLHVGTKHQTPRPSLNVVGIVFQTF